MLVAKDLDLSPAGAPQLTSRCSAFPARGPSTGRHCRGAAKLSVKCLAPAVLGLVFGRGLAVVIGQNTAASQSQVLAGSSVLRLRGNPA